MEDTHTTTDAMGNAQPTATTPTGSPPGHLSPVDRMKAAANRVLAMLTGRTRS
jgi:hypothetical protein